MKSCSPSLRNLLLITVTAASFAPSQAQIPLPGGNGAGGNNEGMQGSNNGIAIQNQVQTQAPPKAMAPIPGNLPSQTGAALTAYQQLPLNHLDAQARIESLKQAIATARPTKDLQESVYQLCEWLTDMANAHYKLSAVFSKHDATKAQADLERKQAQKFSQLKNQAQLLKAELLIRQNRYPEALAPLVDIVANEPRSATGQQAYKRLQQIGFSEEVQAEEKPAAQDTATINQTTTTAVSDNKASATISRASTISVEGYVGTPTATAKPAKTSVVSQPTKAPMPAPNQVLNVR